MENQAVADSDLKLDWSMIFALMLGLFVAGLDTSVVNIMLPKLQKIFLAPLSEIMLIATVYITLMAAFQLFIGRCADIFNSVVIFIFGLILFFAGSLICALSDTIQQILVGRGVQGVGAALLAASFGAIVLLYIPREKTGSVLGAVMMVMSIGVILGPPLGGFFAEHLSWHWAFFINLPLTAISIFILVGFIKKRGGEYTFTDFQKSLKNLDIMGSIFSIVMFLAFPIIFIIGSDKGWGSPFQLGVFLIFLLSSAFFIRTEIRAKMPLIQLSIFRSFDLLLAIIIKGLTMIIMNAMMLIFPFFITGSSDMTVSQAGFYILISAVAMALTTPVAGKMTDRFQEINIIIIASFVFLLVNTGAFFIGTPPVKIIMGVVLAGFGGSMAGLMVASSVLILKQAPKGQEGVFSALNSLVVPVAGSIGLAVFSGIYAFGERNGDEGMQSYAGFTLSMQGVFICTVLLIICAFLCKWIKQK